MTNSISATELAAMLKSDNPPRLLDVREPDEFNIVALPNAILLPLGQIPEQYDELDYLKETPLVVYCHHGLRSLHAMQFLQHVGFKNLMNLSGGIDAWSREVDPNTRRY